MLCHSFLCPSLSWTKFSIKLYIERELSPRRLRSGTTITVPSAPSNEGGSRNIIMLRKGVADLTSSPWLRVFAKASKQVQMAIMVLDTNISKSKAVA